jgi:hypothetical protein
MTSQLSIMENMDTFLNETLHIMPGFAMHFHGHQNKMVPLMKPSMLMDINNGNKFRNCTYWLTNDI